MEESAERFDVQLTKITDWKQHLQVREGDAFDELPSPGGTPDLKALHTEIG